MLTISLTEIVPCLLSLKLANITKLSGWCSHNILHRESSVLLITMLQTTLFFVVVVATLSLVAGTAVDPLPGISALIQSCGG